MLFVLWSIVQTISIYRAEHNGAWLNGEPPPVTLLKRLPWQPVQTIYRMARGSLPIGWETENPYPVTTADQSPWQPAQTIYRLAYGSPLIGCEAENRFT